MPVFPFEVKGDVSLLWDTWGGDLFDFISGATEHPWGGNCALQRLWFSRSFRDIMPELLPQEQVDYWQNAKGVEDFLELDHLFVAKDGVLTLVLPVPPTQRNRAMHLFGSNYLRAIRLKKEILERYVAAPYILHTPWVHYVVERARREVARERDWHCPFPSRMPALLRALDSELPALARSAKDPVSPGERLRTMFLKACSAWCGTRGRADGGSLGDIEELASVEDCGLYRDLAPQWQALWQAMKSVYSDPSASTTRINDFVCKTAFLPMIEHIRLKWTSYRESCGNSGDPILICS